ncbi:TPA: hypothetical protein NJ057_004744 [Vibrio parahaemolyticus]|nr:hypothetical protein [Vibrio parahaemolyticus]HCG9001432.1 hypothetical protein [Vibrio parahaemolyticus]
MLNNKILLTLLSTSILISGCGKDESTSSFSTSSFSTVANQMTEGYSNVNVIVFDDGQSTKQIDSSEYSYTKDGDTKNTHEAINKKKHVLNKDNDINAIASVYRLKDGLGKECVIVHKNSIDINVLKHEVGHCFTPLRYKNNKFHVKGGTSEYNEYLNELSADVVAAALDYQLEKNLKYIDLRIANINSKGDGAVNYKLISPYLIELKDVLKNMNFEYKTKEENLTRLMNILSKNNPPMSEAEYYEALRTFKS